MRNFLTVLSMAALLAACGNADDGNPVATPAAGEPKATSAPDATENETARLNEWFEARWEEQLDFSPVRKTFLGRKDDYDKVDDFSEAAEDEQLAWRRRTTAEMKETFDYDSLTDEAKMSYDIWAYELERAERSLPFRRLDYIFTQMQGPQAFLPQFLIAFHKVSEQNDMEAYITRISGISRGLDQLLERAKLGAEEGVRPPRFAYEGVLQQARALITGEPFGGEGEAPLWSDANAKIQALQEGGKIDEAKANELRDAARQALLDNFKPAYDRLIAWVESDLPNSSAEAEGVGALPNGIAYYDERLAFATTTDMTADEVHEYGLAEVARIRAEMETIKSDVGFEGTLQEFFVFLREDPQFFFPNTDEGREGYIQAAREHLDYIEQSLPEYFGILPKADLEVKRVEPFREQPGAAQHYFPGTPDGSRPGIYYAHLSDMNAMPKHQLEVVAYHEGLPGHHMQIAIAQELESVPEFRTQSFFNAYAEGWGLYAERLAKEMGAYEDPYSDFGRLSTEIWRAIRLVVDTGMHAKGWSEQEAIDFFLENSSMAEGAIRSEVQRYLVTPGQATSYKIGMMKILELRENARAELGEKFDIRGFHDTVLGGGALPLEILERRVNVWIAAQKAT
ncbi:MAG TPA: DUF885 domain-containing protein [Woeseiaceae bacterium]|nr:DUF885 domain-containing protein [Woeseiaceae bacterium]